MARSDDSAQALKFALFPWAGLVLAAGLLLTANASRDISAAWTSVSATIGSALISIAGALLITEIILKPLYIRDILQVARLSAEVHDSGLRTISRASQLQWPDYLMGSSAIKLASGNINVLRSGPWQHVMRLSRSTERAVSLYIPATDPGPLAEDLQDQWKKNACSTKGSTLKIVPEADITQGLLLSCDPYLIVSLAEDPQNDDPVLLVFTNGRGELIEDSLARGIKRLEDSTTTPLFEG